MANTVVQATVSDATDEYIDSMPLSWPNARRQAGTDDGVGRSQKADKARRAKKKVRSGYGDQGDERPKSARRTRR
jgi:hypothetical protein